MLMFLGILLLVFYIISLLKGGSFKSFFENVKKFENEEYLENMGEEERLKEGIKFATSAILVFIAVLALAFGQLFFFIGAFSVDVLVIPTLVMLVWYVGDFIYKMVSKKAREKQKNLDMTKTNPKLQASRVIYILYILYILFLIIL